MYKDVLCSIIYNNQKGEQTEGLIIIALVAQSCLTLCDPMDGSPPGSSVHGILQARILKWVASPSSRGSSQPRGQSCVSCISWIGRRVLYHECHKVAHLFPFTELMASVVSLSD